MDVLIRDINPSVVQELDEKAKEMGVSRQRYIKDILEKQSTLNDISDREMEYRNYLIKAVQMLEKVGHQLEENTNVLHLLMEDGS